MKKLNKKLMVASAIIFCVCSLVSLKLYFQTLHPIRQDYLFLKNMQSTDLSGVEINGYKIGQLIENEEDKKQKNIDVLMREDTVFSLSYYIEYDEKRVTRDDIRKNSITNNGMDISASQEAMISNLGDQYTYIPHAYFKARYVRDTDQNHFIYIDHENKLMLYHLQYTSAYSGYESPEMIMLEELNINKMSRYLQSNFWSSLTGFPVDLYLVLNGHSSSLEFYFLFPFIFTLLALPAVSSVIDKKLKKTLLIPIAIIILSVIGIWILSLYASMR